jgi:hypothetical protein
MGWSLLAVILILVSHVDLARGADASPAPLAYRLVLAQIFGVDGRPAAHRDVCLRGWERRCLGPLLGWPPGTGFSGEAIDQAELRRDGWLYTTDAEGKVTVRIGDFAGWEQPHELPGWGIYALLVAPGPVDAGGVSQRFCACAPKEDLASQNRFYGFGEWGALLPVTPEGLHVTMALNEGYTLHGQVVSADEAHRPLPNVVVNTYNDLAVDTHTGMGGEVFLSSATTDDRGEFTMEHLYFAQLHLEFGGLWMSTKRGDAWQVQETGTLAAPERDNAENIEFGVELHPNFHYTGTVTDAQCQPVEGAEVVAGISSHPRADTWVDSHHFERTTTDAQGHYDLAASSPWATFLEAEDKPHGRVDLESPGYDSAPIPPGKYDLAFPATPNRRL